MRTIHDIHGGIHPPERKALSRPGDLQNAPIPPVLVLPVRQHLGVPALPIVAVGDTVLGGQVLAEAQGVMSVPVHAPSSGTVVAIESRPIAHASGLADQCIVIQTDGEDHWLAFEGVDELARARSSNAGRAHSRSRDRRIGGGGLPDRCEAEPGTRPTY